MELGKSVGVDFFGSFGGLRAGKGQEEDGGFPHSRRPHRSEARGEGGGHSPATSGTPRLKIEWRLSSGGVAGREPRRETSNRGQPPTVPDIQGVKLAWQVASCYLNLDTFPRRLTSGGTGWQPVLQRKTARRRLQALRSQKLLNFLIREGFHKGTAHAPLAGRQRFRVRHQGRVVLPTMADPVV